MAAPSVELVSVKALNPKGGDGVIRLAPKSLAILQPGDMVTVMPWVM
jgi:hypothetical protein